MTHSTIARRIPRRALLATLGAGSLDKLAPVLTGQGLRVAVLSDRDAKSTSKESEATGGPTPDCHTFHWDASSKETTQRSVDAILARAGEPSQVVVHTLPQAAVINRAVVEHDDAQWQAACGTAVLQTIHLLQCLGPP